MFRKCPKHGWLATSEYTTADDGEPVCPICHNDPNNCGREGSALHDFKHKPPNGVLKRAQSNPRDKFTSELSSDSEQSGSSEGIGVEGPLFGDG